MKKFLKPIIQVVLDEINAKNNTDYRISDVEIKFEPVIPTNEQEIAQIAYLEAQTEQLKINNILNAATVIGDEETLKAICAILDLDYEELQAQLEEMNEAQNTADAQKLLGGVVTDESETEAGTEAIFEQ